jgi:Helix-turn-helix domain
MRAVDDCRDPRLRGTAKAVLGCLARHVNDETGVAYPGQQRIAAVAGVSERAVRGALHRLDQEPGDCPKGCDGVHLGLLRAYRQHRPDGSRTSDSYVLDLDAIRALPSAEPKPPRRQRLSDLSLPGDGQPRPRLPRRRRPEPPDWLEHKQRRDAKRDDHEADLAWLREHPEGDPFADDKGVADDVAGANLPANPADLPADPAAWLPADPAGELLMNRPGFGRDSGGWFQAAVSASS